MACTSAAWVFSVGFFVGSGLLASPPAPARSHPRQYVATVWQTEQGLPQNSVNAMVQDRQGYLWIGTFGGLARFDGERFTVFNSADTPGLASGRILSLHESRSGELWIGTVDGGLTRLRDGVAVAYGEGDGLPSRFVSSTREDAAGNLWINTARGIARFAGSRLEAYATHRGRAVSEFYLQERDGSMWFCSGGDVVRFGVDASITGLPVTEPRGLRVHQDRQGSVWLAFTEQYRLVRYSHGAFSEVRLPPPGREVTRQFPLLAMAEDREGSLLLITPAGLVPVRNGELGTVEALPGPAGGGDTAKARNVLVDREGNVWVGTIAAGLVRFRPAPLTAYGKQEGLSDASFSAVFQDREGRIWLGGDALYWYDGGAFHLLPGVANLRAIAQTRDGALWFGGYGGLHRFRSGVLQSFKVEAPAVRAIHEDRQGTLWVGAIMEDRPGGLYRLREGRLEAFPGILDVRDIVEDPGGGGLWVGGLQGLFHLSDGKATLYDQRLGLSNNAVYDIHRDPGGTLWIATYGGGLNRFRDGRFQAITTKEGLPNNMIVQVQEDGKGGLWLSSNQDVVRLGLQELEDFLAGRIRSILPVSYGIAEGMRSSECNGGSPGGWRTPDGRLWFPTLRGVVAIDPLAGDPTAPPVVLEDALAEDWKLADDAISVPPGKNTLDFRFTALSFAAPEKARFKYRLVPFDQEWIDAGTRRTAHYTNMAPGEYSFQVMAANSYGTWNEQGASRRFTLLPHFYQTYWFRALGAIALVALLWTAHLRRVRHLQEQERKFREAIDTIPALAFIALPGGSRTFVNRPWVEYTGQTVEQAMGDGWQASVHPDDLKRVREKWRTAVAGTEPLDFELRYRRADGEYRWFHVRALPLREKHGKHLKWCGVAVDIEDRKRAEQLEADLAHVNRVTLLGELAASISHELKQPLAAAITYARTSLRWLRREQPDVAEATAAIERIVQAGARATEIIDRVRSLYKKAPSQRRLLDVNEVIQEMVVMLRSEATRDAVSMRTQLTGDLPQVMADRIQLQQVLMNLMLNGIEAMADTGGVLTVRSGMDDGRVMISVSDTGVGLPSERERIFDAFVTTKPQGSGMGLAISRTILESHGGRLWATGNEGRGATFHFTVPVAPSHHA